MARTYTSKVSQLPDGSHVVADIDLKRALRGNQGFHLCARIIGGQCVIIPKTLAMVALAERESELKRGYPPAPLTVTLESYQWQRRVWDRNAVDPRFPGRNGAYVTRPETYRRLIV